MRLVAYPVIEAIAKLEFEDGLRWESSLEAAGVLRAAAPSLRSIQTPLRLQIGPGGGVVVIGTLLSDQIPILLSSMHR